ncbi:MAG TPA: phytanoyl-CoA dioxygenase family protein [Acidimicrobiales bacterium]|nr:phytanoyl-CoA dioxygenase family protein [Acidimicrobiales bacterium]
MKRFSGDEVSVELILEAMGADGACIVEGMLGHDEVLAARRSLAGILDGTPRGRNDFEGFTTRRIYALFAKTRAFDHAAVNPLVLGVLDRVLGHYQLSAPVGIEIGPGEKAQVLHRDQAVYPLPTSFPDVVMNTIWALDDFTETNGATRFILGSHRWDDRPSESEDAVCAVMPAGSMAFYVGKLWHGGGANTTDTARLGVILEYVAAWLRPQENHILAVPRETVASLPERLQELLGYNIFPPFVGYVDGRHPRRFITEPTGVAGQRESE